VTDKGLCGALQQPVCQIFCCCTKVLNQRYFSVAKATAGLCGARNGVQISTHQHSQNHFNKMLQIQHTLNTPVVN